MQETFYRSQNPNAGKEPGDLPGLTLYPPSQGGARLSALAKALPLGAPMPAILPAIADAAPLAIADAAGMPALADAAANVMPVIAGAEATDFEVEEDKQPKLSSRRLELVAWLAAWDG